MERIAIIVNSTDMISTAEQAVGSSKEKIRLVQTHTYDESLQWGKSLVSEGYRLLIARGGHAQRLRSAKLGVPIVQIPFTGNDIAAVLMRASSEHSEIAVIGNPFLIQIAHQMERFLNANIYYSEIGDWQDFESQITRVKQLGIKAVVGGYDASRFARAQDLTAYCVTTNLTEINAAITEAQSILDAVDRDKRWNDLFRTVLDTISEGIVVADSTRHITHMNRCAKRIMEDCTVGSTITDPVYVERLNKVLRTGESIYDELTEDNNYKYSHTIIPIYSGDQITEVVMILQEIEYVRKVEQKVRQRIAQKGLVAAKTFDDILGDSEITRNTIQTAKRYALVNSTILIIGESGTGKEMYAQSIHNYSLRKNEAFVAVNCATIPQNLLESELFGYAEGAFTGAKRGGKVGLFELAHNGTIFLDEIGETSLEMQARLLRVLEERQIMRIGDDRVIPVNIRVIAATNKNLRQMVENGTFRSDFYYRLNVLSLDLKPLCSRRADLPKQIEFFVDKYSAEHGRNKFRFTDEGMQVMMQYTWPGNTRELKNIIERLIVTNSTGIVDAREARAAIGQPVSEERGSPKVSLVNTAEFELIRNIMLETGGNKSAAAKRLGISRPTLQRKLKQMEELK